MSCTRESSQTEDYSKVEGTWVRTFGSTDPDVAQAIQKTDDGGYVVAGNTGNSSWGGNQDIWVMKLSLTGEPEWSKTYHFTNFDYALVVQQTDDNGYLLGGWSDGWILMLKLFPDGNIEWQRSLQGEKGCSMQQTTDRGYIVSASVGGQIVVLKFDNSGKLQWQFGYKSPGGGNQAGHILQTADNGYALTGSDSSGLIFLKLDSTGGINWQKTYGGMIYMFERLPFQLCADGGYILAQGTNRFGAGHADAQLVKLDASGNIMWQRVYGGKDDEYANAVVQTDDGGFLVAGLACSFIDPQDNDGVYKKYCWLFKLSTSGDIEWEKVYGEGDSGVNCISVSGDDRFVAAGDSMYAGKNWWDLLVFKITPFGEIDTRFGSTGQKPFVYRNSQALVNPAQLTSKKANLTRFASCVSIHVSNIIAQTKDANTFLVKPIKK